LPPQAQAQLEYNINVDKDRARRKFIPKFHYKACGGASAPPGPDGTGGC